MPKHIQLDAEPLRRPSSSRGLLDARGLVRETLSRTLGPSSDLGRTLPSWPSATVGKGSAPAAGAGGVPAALQGMLERLSALRPGVSLCETSVRSRHEPDVAIPAGATFEDKVFRGPSGSLGYRLYVPSTAGSRVMPLVVMMHGCTQSPEDFAAGTRMNEVAEELGVLVAYPRQTQAANLQKCWNWFDAKDQHRDAGEPALIAGLTREILRDHAADPARVYVAGLSAGGAAAAIMGQTYPDLYAAVGVHSGLPAGAASDVPSAFAAMRQGAPPTRGAVRVPTIVFHGDRDRTVHPANGGDVVAQAAGGATYEAETLRGQASGALDYARTVWRDDAGRPMLELWMLAGAGHAWSGGSPLGSYTEARGPDASREMVRFFLQHVQATTSP